MCGRTCLTLQPDEILCACKYTTKVADSIKKQESNSKINLQKEESKYEKPTAEHSTDLYIKPEWRAEFNCGRIYVPSYNIAPTDITPVLISANHFGDDNNDDSKQKRIVVPMMWGMIPFWHKGGTCLSPNLNGLKNISYYSSFFYEHNAFYQNLGSFTDQKILNISHRDYKKHGLKTNNCRLEHMLESKLYARPFKRGQRCVVLCEGFYEWQTTKTAKPSERAAYFIYMPQNDDIKIYDSKTWTTPESVNLLKMAGLFDVWTDENGDKIYSYSVITVESTKILSWMHHRMPAILETEQQVNDWLDLKRVTDKQALAALRPAENLRWYRVSNIVNNSRNKSSDCNKPFELTDSKRNEISNNSKNKTLLSWLNVRKRREKALAAAQTEEESEKLSDVETDDGGKPSKRQKFSEFKKSLNELNYVSSTDSCGSLKNDKSAENDCA